jgi:hypothetical protein
MLLHFFRRNLVARAFIFGLIPGLVFALSSPAQAAKYKPLQTEGWSGEKLYDDSGRTLRVCYLYGPKDGQVRLGVRMLPNKHKALLLYNPDWSLPTGDVYDLTISFDGMRRMTVQAEAIGQETLGIDLIPGGSVEQGFRQGSELTIAAARAVYHFPLSGSARALSTVTQCFEPAKRATRPPASSGRGSSSNPFGEGTPPSGDGGGGGGHSSNPFGSALPNSGDSNAPEESSPSAPYIPRGLRNDIRFDQGDQPTRLLGDLPL